MTRPPLAAIATLAALLASPVLAAPAMAADSWQATERDGTLGLVYAQTPPAGEAPNAETVQIGFACDKGSGVVAIFVAESAETLKPGERTRLTLTIAGVATGVEAKIEPNELAGIPSLRATLPVGMAVFNLLAQMGRAGRGELQAAAGDWSARYPLTTMGGKAARFVGACGPSARQG